MQRPLVRRRHTVFHQLDLNQLIGVRRSSSESEAHPEATVDHPGRPGLHRCHKTLSFHQPSTRQSFQLAMENDVIDVVTEPLNDIVTSGTELVSECHEGAPVLAAEEDTAELAVVMETIADHVPDANDALDPSPVMSSAEEKVGNDDLDASDVGHEKDADTVAQTEMEDRQNDEVAESEQDGVQEDVTMEAGSHQASPRDSQTAEKTDEIPPGDELEGPEEQETEEQQHDEPEVQESNDIVDEENAKSTHESKHNDTYEDYECADVDDRELPNACNEELPADKPVAGEDQATTTTQTKSEQTETKTGSSRPKNATSTKSTSRKAWKPAGSALGLVPPQIEKTPGSTTRGKPSHQNHDAAVTRLPPISVSGMTAATDRRRQPGAGSGDVKGMDALTRRRNNDTTSTMPHVGTGRQYKCSATAYVTVLYQPAADTELQSPDTNDQQLPTSANRNRKYNGSTTTKMNGDRLPLVVADNKNLTSHASIVGGDSLRIVVDGFRVPQRNDVISGGEDPVSVRIDVAMSTGGGGRLARRHEGCTGGAYRQAPMLPGQQRQLVTTDRDVISTRAIGPAFFL